MHCVALELSIAEFHPAVTEQHNLRRNFIGLSLFRQCSELQKNLHTAQFEYKMSVPIVFISYGLKPLTQLPRLDSIVALQE